MCKKINAFALITLVIAVLLTVLGSFYDYEISDSLYIGERAAENPFGIIFAYVGIVPTFAGWAFLGAGIFSLAKRKYFASLN